MGVIEHLVAVKKGPRIGGRSLQGANVEPPLQRSGGPSCSEPIENTSVPDTRRARAMRGSAGAYEGGRPTCAHGTTATGAESSK
jgi:hypothetical protein